MRVEVNSSHIQLRSSSGNLVLRVKYQVSSGQVKFVVRDVEAHQTISNDRSTEKSASHKSDHLTVKPFPMIDHLTAK